ncbi:MAG: hypothetical protein JWP97_2077 [Labilithrix sp.]|nr:hypothetical protein [Labilithrix sp.]
MRAVTVLVGLVTAGLALFVMVSRLVYPIDAEWMAGAVRDTVERVRDQQPIYAKPSSDFISFLYPPLYYWLSGLFARFVSTFAACKLVSLGATLGTTVGVGLLTRRLGASRFWCLVAVLLHFGTYSLTLFFYDLERVDSFAVAVVTLGLVVLLGKPGDDAPGTGSTARTALGGVILGLSFFAKQPGIAVFIASIVGLVLAGERRKALVAGGAGALAFAALFAYLETTTGPWFRYYCVKLPGLHGVQPKLLATFFIEDVPRAFALTAASVATIARVVPAAWAMVRRAERPRDIPWHQMVFAVALGAALTSGYLLRTHRGGWANVILAWTPLACVATAWLASRLEARAAGSPAGTSLTLALLAGVTLQLVTGLYDPTDFAPSEEDRHASWMLEQSVRAMEAKGDVIVTPTGNVSRRRHFHSAALFDVLRANDPAPTEYLADLRAHRYAALYTGAPDEFNCDWKHCQELSDATIRNYFVAGRFYERKSTGTVGFDGKVRWIMRPRKTPLTDLARKDVERRLRAEASLAAERRLRAGAVEIPLPDDDIELRAAEVPQ